MTYREIEPFLRGGKIVFQDRFGVFLKQEEIQRRLIDHVRPAKDKPDILVVVIK